MKKRSGRQKRENYRENIFFTIDAEYGEDEYGAANYSAPGEEERGAAYVESGDYGAAYGENGDYGAAYGENGDYGAAYGESGDYDAAYGESGEYGAEYGGSEEYAAAFGGRDEYDGMRYDDMEYYEDDGIEYSDEFDPGYDADPDLELGYAEEQYQEKARRGEKKDRDGGFFSRLKSQGLMDAVRSLTPFQYALTAMSVLLFVTAVACGVFYYNYSVEQKELLRQAELKDRAEEAQAANETPVYMEVLKVEEAPEAVLAEEPPEPEEEPKQLSLVLTSMDKDLKIKVVDQDDNLVKDVAWKVTVLNSKQKEKEYADEDKDAIIYIKDIEPGEYSVVLQSDESLEGFLWPDSGADVAVKGQLEYKAVAEIKNEIKKEAEVNVAAEDTEHNNVVTETKPVVSDTVEWCESTKTEIASEDKAEFVEYKGSVSVPKDTARADGVLDRLFAGETRTVGMAGLSSFRSILLAMTAGTVSDPSLPQEPDKKSYTVLFADHDGREISRQTVEEGKGAMAPDNPSREGYAFEKWDRDFSNVTSDMTVTAVYKEANAIDKSGKLTDDKGNILYKKVGEEYVEATGEDWANDLRTYYRKVESSEATYKYTGWQTIEGKTYYFKSDGEKVTGDQIIGGVTYHFDSDGALGQNSGTMGIDVSKWNGTVNWAAVRASGVSYAIIRCGYRGSSTGALIEDPTFRANIAGAKAAGIKVGVYFFTQAVTEAEAVEEASMCIALCQGYGLSYPLFLDVESGPRANGLDAASRTAVIRAFCETVKASGYTPGVYANKTWLTSKMNASQLGGYKIWLAQYNTTAPTYAGHFDLWQFTSKGTINGVNGFVDFNQSYLGY